MRTINAKRSIPSDASYFGFGLKDDKGRSLGCFTYTRMARFVEAPVGADLAHVRSDLAPGDYYAFSTQSARAGKCFARPGVERYFKTHDERADAIAKYRADAEKRAMRMRGTEVTV